MKLDTTLFELDVIYESMTHSTAWGITIDLKEIKEDLIELRNEYIKDASEFGEFVDEISEIDVQLIFVNKNIRTFENALMCFETKIFEKRTSMGDLGFLCLN